MPRNLKGKFYKKSSLTLIFLFFHRSLLLYNSLAMPRKELICFRLNINVTNLSLKDATGNIVPLQLNYVWSGVELVSSELEACFMASLSPLSVTFYKMKNSVTSPSVAVSLVKLYNFEHHISEKFISSVETPSEIELQSTNLKLIFSGADGMLRRVIQYDEGLTIKTHEIRSQLMTYGTKSAKNEQKSGAYLFMPGKNRGLICSCK